MAISVTISFTACKDDGFDAVMKFIISSNPKTLDPQQANELNSNTIIENVYMGLMRVGADGTINCGVAESYTVSDDGLVYNFVLRQDIFWKSVGGFEAQCTAKDFVFGFKRLFMPSTDAARASDYYCIKNSKAVHTGELSPSSIWVKASGDFELEITLEYPDSRFLAMLAEPPAMPCNEEFFNTTHSKYGLSAECTASNGAFYVRSWSYDPYSDGSVNNVLLSRNALNAAAYNTCPSGVNYFFDDKSKFISDFTSGSSYCVAVSNDEIKNLEGEDYIYTEYSTVTCGLVFNRNFDLFRSKDFLNALTLLIDWDDVQKAYGEDYKTAQGIIPEQVLVGNRNYRNEIGSVDLYEYDTAKAREIFRSEKPKLSSNLFTGARVIVCSETAKNAISYILQEWQREFGFYCVVEQLSESKFNERVQSGEYEIAVMELSGKYNSPAAYLEQFCSDNSANYSGFVSQDFDSLIKQAKETTDEEQLAELYKQAEQMLIDKCAFVPLYYKNEYFLMNEDCSDIVYNPFLKTINFLNAKKK